MEEKILEVLTAMQTDMKEMKAEMNTGFKELKADINQINNKLDLLTKQTSNAVVENHSNQISFIKDKVFSLEQSIFELKKTSN